MGVTIRQAGIEVSIARETRAPSQKGFGSMAFITAVMAITDRIKLYGSVDEVGLDYPSPSEETTAAAFWFAQNPSPEFFYIIQNKVLALPTAAIGTIDIAGDATVDGDYGVMIDSEQYIAQRLVKEVPATASIGSFDLISSSPATGDGGIGIDVDGDIYSITPTAGDTSTDMATAIAALIAADATAVISAVVTGARLDITAKTPGLAGDAIVMSLLTTDTTATGIVEQLRGGADLVPATSGADIAATIAGLISADGKHLAVASGTKITITNNSKGVDGNLVTVTETPALAGITTTIVAPTGGTKLQMQEGLEASLDAALTVNPEFYAVSVNAGFREFQTATEDVAQWVEVNERLFFAGTNDPGVLDPTATGDIASVLQATSYTRTYLHYSSHKDEYPEIGAFALLATTSFRGKDTLKTLKFKSIALVTREILTANELQALRAKSANIVFRTAGINMIDAGRTTDSRWIDEIHGTDALAEEIRVRVFGLLARVSTKVPYTEEGMALLKSEVIGALNQYRRNGFLAEGVDKDGNFLDAFAVSSALVSQASIIDKAGRIAPDIEFWARVAGAVHSVKISGRLIL